MPYDPRAYRKDCMPLTAETVTLLVGEKQEEQNVHKDLLCEHSGFFPAATKKEWLGHEANIIPLPEDDPEIVNLFVHWLYRRKIFTRPPIEDIGKGVKEFTMLAGLFLFGEKIQCDDLKNAVIDALIMTMHTPDQDGRRWYPIGIIDQAYEGTPTGSPLRRVLVDMYLSRGGSAWIKGTENKDFLADLSRALIDSNRTRPNPDPVGAKTSTCQYHRHTGDNGCYAASMTQ